MKHALLFVVVLFSSPMLFAQPGRATLVIQSGVSVPLFAFSGTELGKSSFALPGFGFAIEGQVALARKWRGVVQAGLQLNPVDVGLLGYEKMQADPFLESMYIRSDPYRTVHLMAGPAYHVKLRNKLRLEGHLTAGAFFSSTPYQLHKTKYFLTGPPFYEITASKDVSFAWGGGARVVYEVTPCYHIGMGSQYMQSRASYRFTTGSGIRTDVRDISLWNTSITLIINLF